MFLHLGGEVSVDLGDIIGVFDYKLLDTVTFREFLQFSQWDCQVVTLGGETKSLVVAQGKIYLTPVSRATLARRWASMPGSRRLRA